MINKFIKGVCKILKIKIPSVSFDIGNFTSQTMLAQFLADGTCIFLKKYDEPNPDRFFAIAHELRHVWQHKKDEAVLWGYKPIELCNFIDEYNLQPAELDANAFACIIMNNFFESVKSYSSEQSGLYFCLYSWGEIPVCFLKMVRK